MKHRISKIILIATLCALCLLHVSAQSSREQMYAPMLDSCAELALHGVEGHALLGHEAGIMEQLLYGEMFAPNTIGYGFRDLNGDGTDELIIGHIENPGEVQTAGSTLFCVATIQDGSPVAVLSGGSRNHYALTDGGKIYNHGSGGAAWTCFGLYELNQEGELEALDFYFSSLSEDDLTVCYYNNPCGEWNAACPENTSVDESSFFDLERVLSSMVTEIPLTPITSYQSTNNIYGFWLNEVSLGDVEYGAGSSDSALVLTTMGNAAYEISLLHLELEVEDTEFSFRKEVVGEMGRLEQGSPMVMQLEFVGDIPQNGIRCTSSDGEITDYAIEVSGKDGSVILSPIC